MEQKVIIQIGWVVKTINITSKQPINCKINMWAYSWSQNACNVCASFTRTKCMVKYPLHTINFDCNSKPTWLAPKYNTNDIANNVSHSLIKHTKLILYIEGPKGGGFNFFMVSTQISFATICVLINTNPTSNVQWSKCEWWISHWSTHKVRTTCKFWTLNLTSNTKYNGYKIKMYNKGA